MRLYEQEAAMNTKVLIGFLAGAMAASLGSYVLARRPHATPAAAVAPAPAPAVAAAPVPTPVLTPASAPAPEPVKPVVKNRVAPRAAVAPPIPERPQQPEPAPVA